MDLEETMFFIFAIFENIFRVTTKNKYTEIFNNGVAGQDFPADSCSFLTKKCGRIFFAQIFYCTRLVRAFFSLDRWC